MKHLLALMVAVLLLGTAVPTQAQEEEESTPPRPRRVVEAARRILDLSDAQVQELLDLRQANSRQLRELRTQIRDLRQQQRELLESSDADPNQVGSLVIQQHSLGQQMRSLTQSLHDSALGVLTDEQKEKVAQIQQALRLAPQAGPLTALGLIQPPRDRRGPRRFRFFGEPAEGFFLMRGHARPVDEPEN